MYDKNPNKTNRPIGCRSFRLMWLTAASILCLSACQRPAEREQAVQSPIQRYFSLEQYFGEQIRDLKRSAPKIVKTVEANGNSETRTLPVTDWETELAPFIESDINKASWVNSYTTDSNATTMVYESLEEGLRTKKIVVKKNGQDEVKEIQVHNEVSNLLYTSREWLRYYPDSLYEIIREQDIRVVGHNRYHITGQFGPGVTSGYPDKPEPF